MVLHGLSYVEHEHQSGVVPDIIPSLVGGEGSSLRERQGRYRESMGRLCSRLTGDQASRRLGAGRARKRQLVL